MPLVASSLLVDCSSPVAFIASPLPAQRMLGKGIV